jgi:MarR family transcriptional regulator, temperature-dependent positive regulator of motility
MTQHQLRSADHGQDSSEGHEPLDVVLNDNAISTIWRLNHLVHRYAHPFYRMIEDRYNVSRIEYLTLHCLGRIGVLRAQQIVYILARPKNTVSDAVNSLLKKGLIQRTQDPNDARIGLLNLTPAGRHKFEEILPLLIDRQKKILSPLSQEEREAFDHILDKLIACAPEWWTETI